MALKELGQSLCGTWFHKELFTKTDIEMFFLSGKLNDSKRGESGRKKSEFIVIHLRFSIMCKFCVSVMFSNLLDLQIEKVRY